MYKGNIVPLEEISQEALETTKRFNEKIRFVPDLRDAIFTLDSLMISKPIRAFCPSDMAELNKFLELKEWTDFHEESLYTYVLWDELDVHRLTHYGDPHSGQSFLFDHTQIDFEQLSSYTEHLSNDSPYDNGVTYNFLFDSRDGIKLTHFFKSNIKDINFLSRVPEAYIEKNLWLVYRQDVGFLKEIENGQEILTRHLIKTVNGMPGYMGWYQLDLRSQEVLLDAKNYWLGHLKTLTWDENTVPSTGFLMSPACRMEEIN